MTTNDCEYLINYPNTKNGYLCGCPEPCEHYIRNAVNCPVIKQIVAKFSER
jgi:hypothetical protein